MSSVEVRRLRGEHASEFRDIRLKALRSAPDVFGSTHETEVGRSLDWFAERADSGVVFGVYSSGSIAGMAGFGRETGPKEHHKGFVWGFFVDPALRGQGIGSVLLDAILRHAEGEVEQLRLTVVAGNDDALKLYQKAGFQTYGIEPRALKNASGYQDEILMMRYVGQVNGR